MPAPPPSPRRRRLSRALPGVAAGFLLLAWGFGGSLLPPEGPVLLHVESPLPGELARPGGVQVLVRLAPGGHAAPETLRVLLNGADVTPELVTGDNGAWGRLTGLLDGENVLRVEIFGTPWWTSHRYFEQTREVRFRLVRPLGWNQG